MDSYTYKGLREMIGYTAQDMAEHHTVALKTVQRWENGHRDIPAGVADELLALVREFKAAAQPGGVCTCGWGHPDKWYRMADMHAMMAAM